MSTKRIVFGLLSPLYSTPRLWLHVFPIHLRNLTECDRLNRVRWRKDEQVDGLNEDQSLLEYWCGKDRVLYCSTSVVLELSALQLTFFAHHLQLETHATLLYFTSLLMFARLLAHYAHRHSTLAPKSKRLSQGKWGEVRCELWISRLKCWDVDKYACEHVSKKKKKKEKNTSPHFFTVLTQQRWPTLSATKQRNTLFPSQPTKWASRPSRLKRRFLFSHSYPTSPLPVRSTQSCIRSCSCCRVFEHKTHVIDGQTSCSCLSRSQTFFKIVKT